MKPFGYTPSKKYPVVVYIHGGPHSQYDEGWFDRFQSLAGGGMMVLYTNPRGSSGYNTEFTNASRGDWGGKDYWDIMKATDIVAARPDVDSTRMGVTGGSYGGFMTAWIRNEDQAFQSRRVRPDDRELDELVQRQRRAEPHGRRVLRKAVGESGDVRHAVAHQVRSQGEDADTHCAERRRSRAPIIEAEQWFMSLRKQECRPSSFGIRGRTTISRARGSLGFWWTVSAASRRWFTYWLKP